VLTSPKIVRLAASRRFGQILDEVSRNGRPLPQEARLHLALPDHAEVAALALGSQRLLELGTGAGQIDPCLFAQLMTASRSALDRPAAPGVLALALGALLDVAGHQACSPASGGGGPASGDIGAAGGMIMALHDHLSAAQAPGGLVGSLIDSALVFWQLGPRSTAIVPDGPQRGPNLDRLETALARVAPPQSGAGMLLALGRALRPITRRAA